MSSNGKIVVRDLHRDVHATILASREIREESARLREIYLAIRCETVELLHCVAETCAASKALVARRQIGTTSAEPETEILPSNCLDEGVPSTLPACFRAAAGWLSSPLTRMRLAEAVSRR